MAEGFYRIKVPEDAKTSLVEGKDTLIVSAESSAEAILAAKAYLHLPSDAAWAASTPVLLAHVTDLEGWRAKISIYDTAAALLEQVTVTADSADGFDEIGDDLVVALNLTTSIAGAAYATPALTIAETTDGIGDHTVVVEFLPPITWDDPTISFPTFRTSIVHEGAGGAALSCNLIDVVAPTVLYELGSGS